MVENAGVSSFWGSHQGWAVGTDLKNTVHLNYEAPDGQAAKYSVYCSSHPFKVQSLVFIYSELWNHQQLIQRGFLHPQRNPGPRPVILLSRRYCFPQARITSDSHSVSIDSPVFPINGNTHWGKYPPPYTMASKSRDTSHRFFHFSSQPRAEGAIMLPTELARVHECRIIFLQLPRGGKLKPWVISSS